jgi:D-sedoheptulose 7-phosphate isomerase
LKLSDEIKKIIFDAMAEREKMLRAAKNNYPDAIMEIAQALASSLSKGGKILICGNGGSAADSQHFAAEMIVRLTSKFVRAPLAAIALSTDTSVLTAAANDYGYDAIFARQVQALGKKGDVLIAITTSGNSANIIKALEVAKGKKMVRIGLLGNDGGRAKALCHHTIVVPSQSTLRIQEEHIFILHTLVAITEQLLYSQE